jgi:chlorobactene lauroyltransferase
MIEARNHPLFEAAFRHYLRDLARKRFHAVRIAGREHLQDWDPHVPTVAYANHSNWWDGFMAFLITHLAEGGRFHVMMEERHLERYPYFSRIGAFGVDREHPRAARETLSHARILLGKPRATVWIFPQGILRPNDVRPLAFYPGASRLALEARETYGAVRLLPVAMRYEFLQEDRPEALLRIAPPTLLTSPLPARELNMAMERTLTELLDGLRAQVAREDLAAFEPLVEGGMSLNKRLDAMKVRLGLLPREAFDPRNGT